MVEEEESLASTTEVQCLYKHARECEYFEGHPLIMDVEFYDFRKDYEKQISEKTQVEAELAVKDPKSEVYVTEEGKIRLKTDPLENPKFGAPLKMCTRRYSTEETLADGLQQQATDLIFCKQEDRCCGAPDLDEDDNEIDRGECCNVY